MEKRDNVIFNFGRIEYLRTKSGYVPFTSKALQNTDWPADRLYKCEIIFYLQ